MLASVLIAAAASVNAFSWRFAAITVVYTLVPAAISAATWRVRSPNWSEPLIIALLWLPLEFAAGADLIPKSAQGFIHSAAYGVSILLALSIFLLHRRFDGMRYRLPSRASDIGLPVLVFLIAAPVLVLVGRAVGFIPAFHDASVSAGHAVRIFVLIFVATALPEEILFRALIQNWITRKFGASYTSIGIAAVIFGASHLNNGPGSGLNWPYAVVATLAGFAFGLVFQRSSSVLSSALLHALVNITKRVFF